MTVVHYNVTKIRSYTWSCCHLIVKAKQTHSLDEEDTLDDIEIDQDVNNGHEVE